MEAMEFNLMDIVLGSIVAIGLVFALDIVRRRRRA